MNAFDVLRNGLTCPQILATNLDSFTGGRSAHRLEEGRKPATAKNELSVLKRAFNLAQKVGKASRPEFPTIRLNNVRTGFFEREDFDKVLSRLSDDLKAPMEFAYLTGWRMGEVIDLQWKQVEFKAGVIRLEPGSTKNRDGRTLPFGVLTALVDLLKNQQNHTSRVQAAKGQVIPLVFHRDGKPIPDMREAWKSACAKARVSGMLRHDLRRTAVRNLERAGVPRSVAMKITGHRTESIYSRYAISNTNDQREGLKKLAALLAADRKQG